MESEDNSRSQRCYPGMEDLHEKTPFFWAANEQMKKCQNACSGRERGVWRTGGVTVSLDTTQ